MLFDFCHDLLESLSLSKIMFAEGHTYRWNMKVYQNVGPTKMFASVVTVFFNPFKFSSTAVEILF